MMRSLARWWRLQQARWHYYWTQLTWPRLGRRFGTLIETLWFIVKYPFVLVGRFFALLWRAASAAWTQLYIRYFLQGLPALAAIIACGVITAFAYLRGSEGLADLYRRDGYNALATQSWSKARLCYERLVQLNPRDPESRFHLAESLMYSKQDMAQAQAMFAELAPLDHEKGYAMAHVRLAMQLLYGNPGAVNADLQMKIEKHLTRALNPANVPPLPDEWAAEARALLGQFYYRIQGRDSDAEPLLLSAASGYGRQALRLDLAEIYRKRNRMDLVRDQCRLAMIWFRGLAEGNIDDVRSRIQWARCHALMDEYAEAIAILEKGIKLAAHIDYRIYLSSVYVQQANFIRQRSKDNKDWLGPYLANLERALLAYPPNPAALECLVDLTRTRSPEGQKAKETLRDLLAANGASPMLHFCVGVLAYEENKPEEACMHWERAYKLDPDLAIVGNNLAWSLATVEKNIDLSRALEISNGVIKANPNVGIFHGTRGFIYYKMARYREAVDDLELSLTDNDKNPEVNRHLAECYAALGNKSMADAHLKMENMKRQKNLESLAPGPNRGG